MAPWATAQGAIAQLFVGLPQMPAVTSVTLAPAASAATAGRPCGPSVRGATRLDFPKASAFASRRGAGAHAPNPKTKMVGLGRLERPTSPLSGVRSNHLSYRPETQAADEPPGSRPEAPIARMSKKKEKRRRRRPAWWVLTEPNDPKKSNSSSGRVDRKLDPESAEEPSLERR